MRKILIYSILLVLGLTLSQTILPGILNYYPFAIDSIHFLTYLGLAFIMFFVGLEFHLDKKNLKNYKTDYIVAFTAATFPWILTSLYFVATQFSGEGWLSLDAWRESLFVGRFAAPTSAGILFTMLAAAGLAGTWIFKKIRILAIFDDLDTVLLLIPLKILVMGFAWQLSVVLFILVFLSIFAWVFLRKVDLPLHGIYPMLFSLVLVIICQSIYYWSKGMNPQIPIHIEVLFPSFVLGLVVKLDDRKLQQIHSHERSLSIVGGIFMLLVGLNMPYVMDQLIGLSQREYLLLGFHVLMITLLSNLGKLYVLFNYQDEATLRERLAVGIGMLPRGEVGAGVLVMALGLGLGGKIITIAMASLTLNLLLTGVFIWAVKRLSLRQKVQRKLVPLNYSLPL
ncbi:MAG: sodium:proton antiporter [Bacteriovoracaceae bacterium]